MPQQGQIAGNFCSYDLCAADGDCADAGVCLCGTSIGTVGSDGTPIREGNRCVPANCRVDSDCGAGGVCSPTVGTSCGPRNGIVGYECHTPSDTCTTDAQCQDGGLGGYCAFQPTLGHWACSFGFCAG
jgi:Cys-rich repeat protein